MEEIKVSKVDITKMSHILSQAENYFKEAQKDYEAGYLDYDAKSKAYILDHAIAFIDSAINLLTPYADYPAAKDCLSRCSKLKDEINKEHPDK